VGVFDQLLASLGWPGVIGAATAIGLIFGGIRVALLAAVGFAILGSLGLWASSMAVLSMMLAAVLLALGIGLPLGIAAGRSERLASALSPVLDFMQIMPTLAYLTPITLLFLIGVAPSVIATLIFAVPAAIRITAWDPGGAGDDRGSGSLARRDRDAGAHEGAAPAVAPARGPGDQPDAHARAVDGGDHLAHRRTGPRRNLQNALSKVDVGASFDAGIAIVILAIILDRLTYAAGEWADPRERAMRKGPRWVTIAAALALVGIGLALPLVLDATTFPDTFAASFREPVNAIVDWFTNTFHAVTIGIKDVARTWCSTRSSPS